MSLVLASVAGTAFAEDATKPTAPTFSDVLDASGIALSGYIDPWFQYHTYSGEGASTPKDVTEFTLNQVGLTIAKQPTEGFGGVVNVIGSGTNDGTGSANSIIVQQGYMQYATGPWTVIAGKYTTLVGAEVVAPTGNTNVSRSLLFGAEPVAHTGVRVTYALNSMVTLTGGLNNGWYQSFLTGQEEPGDGQGKSVELGVSVAPSKTFSISAQGYWGRDSFYDNTTDKSTKELLDLVSTWSVTDAFTLVGSIDWADINKANGDNSAVWYGVAAYGNYAINDTWRVSLRGEYFNDKDGYLTGVTNNHYGEGTLTFGFAPVKSFELRLEGRYDASTGGDLKTTSGYLEALYKF
jgi:hypothetical protein